MKEIIFPIIFLECVKGVLIDLDNTLYDYKSCHQLALTACYNTSIADIMSSSEFKSLYRNCRNEVTQRLSPQGACRSRLLAFELMFEQLMVRHPYSEALKYDTLYWQVLMDNAILSDNAKAFLEKCKNQNTKVCIVTDMLTDIQIRKIKQLYVEPYIDYLVTSEEAGAEKPDAKIFALALSKLNMKAGEVIMIGDDEVKDIQGAQNYGIKSYKVFSE